MKAKLLTRWGEFVQDFEMPPFRVLPEACIWGSRLFILKEPFKIPASDIPVYYEVCAWSVDASLSLSQLAKETGDEDK